MRSCVARYRVLHSRIFVSPGVACDCGLCAFLSQAGNVVTGEMVEELILSGADIIKVGVGPGKACWEGQQRLCAGHWDGGLGDTGDGQKGACG